ncbi:PREDICTED: PHD finger protein ALFIN-LIKE 4 isoform X1 [Tarenaya hassleriana]|uniref:PHD finger protein ALFIN-LIKE 4 isoform X1 n=1 Tax=Tarenaya hassleriana TaxID=28532 RepID=UPI0008FD4B6C|nr:PREDICTED: PHD finger protein ALFIN-LIKE 4 isoform X1 [Tarenaya hassleriana]
MDGSGAYNPRTVEEVFRDFKGRRAGMIKALTADVQEFYRQCDPEKENLCLYGHPNEHWEVNLPAEEVPPELPEPVLGINFARDGMQEKDWLSLVSVHSDAWLLAVAFFFAARFGFDKADRKRLFNMINDLPTIFEVVTGTAKKQTKEKSSVSNNSSNKSKSNSKNLEESIPSQHPRTRRKTRVWKMRRMKSKGRHYVGHVERTTHLMNSGSAVTSARTGSMESVSRSHQQGRNISSNINARLAATRGLGLDHSVHLHFSRRLLLCIPWHDHGQLTVW